MLFPHGRTISASGKRLPGYRDPHDLDPLITGNVRVTLGGLSTAIPGVGPSGHTPERLTPANGATPVLVPRSPIGRTPVQAANTGYPAADRLIETWQRKFPERRRCQRARST